MREVFLLCEYPTLNGGERSMLATLDGLRASGFTPAVIGPPHGPLADELTRRRVEVLGFCCRTVEGERRPLGCLREQLAELLTHRRPALLHANSLSMGRLSGPVAARLRLPSVAHLRDIVKLNAQVIADLNCHQRLLAVSDATRTHHIAQSLSADKTRTLYNGVDLDLFQPRTVTKRLHHELGLPSDALLIGTIGQLGLRKAQDVLLRAAEMIHMPSEATGRIASVLDAAHYLIIGERNSDKQESRQFESQLHRMAQCEPLAGRVHFLGRRNDMVRLLGELTLVVHPARQEPLGRVLLEAAATGVPTIATAVGGTPEIFPPDSQSARLIPPDDPQALAAEIRQLLHDESLRRRLAAAARLRAEQQFDIRQAVAGLIAHYESLLYQNDT
ncbi:MAG: glycosyltransferase family 4 protein [Thermoguttaceae bacterium]